MTKEKEWRFLAKHQARSIETPSGWDGQRGNKHIIVILIDRSNHLGEISQKKWKAVELKLLDALFVRLDGDSGTPMPNFDGTSWLNWVQILKCRYELSLLWVKQSILFIPKAKILISRAVQPEDTLRLLRRQHPDVPPEDWSVLKVTNSGK